MRTLTRKILVSVQLVIMIRDCNRDSFVFRSRHQSRAQVNLRKFLGERKCLSRALFPFFFFPSLAISLGNSEIEDNSSREKLNVQLRVIKIVFVHPLPTKIRFSPPLQKFIFTLDFPPPVQLWLYSFFFSPVISA